jgi:hypothetical protein
MLAGDQHGTLLDIFYNIVQASGTPEFLKPSP